MNYQKINFDLMAYALYQAYKAYQINEVPVGAIVSYNNKVIGSGFNQTCSQNDPTAHAEIIALREASKKMSTSYLSNCDIYVTLEPCTMCLGALINSKIKRLFFSTYANKYNFIFNNIPINLLDLICIKNNISYFSGLMSHDSQNLLHKFFCNLRVHNN